MQDAVGFFSPFNSKFTKESFSEIFLNRLRFDRIMVMSLWPPFVAHPVNIQLSTGFYCVWCELQHCKLLPTVAHGKFKTRTHLE